MFEPVTYDSCMRCGSVVEDSPEAKEIHDEWHEKMNELIEWAQSVSEAIK